MSDRDDIAAALNAVEGINVYPGFRESTKVGNGWITLAKMTPQEFGYIKDWKVTIVIPNQITAAEEWMDGYLEVLAEAVKRQLEVTQILPTQISVSGTTVYAVVIQGVR